MDGSSKFNEFVCGALEFLIKNNLDVKYPIKVIALMFRGYAELGTGSDFEIRDDRYEILSKICKDSSENRIENFVNATMGKFYLENKDFMSRLEKEIKNVFELEIENFLQ